MLYRISVGVWLRVDAQHKTAADFLLVITAHLLFCCLASSYFGWRWTARGCGVCGVTGDVFISLSTIFHNHHKDVPYSSGRVRHWNVASVALLWKSPGKENNRLTTKKFQQIERSCHFSSFGFFLVFQCTRFDVANRLESGVSWSSAFSATGLDGDDDKVHILLLCVAFSIFNSQGRNKNILFCCFFDIFEYSWKSQNLLRKTKNKN